MYETNRMPSRNFNQRGNSPLNYIVNMCTNIAHKQITNTIILNTMQSIELVVRPHCWLGRPPHRDQQIPHGVLVRHLSTKCHRNKRTLVN